MQKITGFMLSLCLTGAGASILCCSGDNNDAARKTETEEVRTQAPPTSYQTRDAFSGKLVKRYIYSDYNGKRVFFCCANSKADFLKDPEKYMQRFSELGVTLQDAPTAKQDSGSN